LKKRVYVQHESLRSANDKLVHTSNGVGTNFGTVVLEKLQEFGYENVQGTIQRVAVQSFRRILANLLECTKCSLFKQIEIFKIFSSRVWILMRLLPHKHCNHVNPAYCKGRAKEQASGSALLCRLW
jgi:hypothetical protein